MSDFLKAQSERSWAKLQALSDDQLVSYHDALSNTTGLRPDYYRDELRYRRQRELTRAMLRLTRRMLSLTIVIAVLTGVVTVTTVHNAIQDGPLTDQAAPE